MKINYIKIKFKIVWNAPKVQLLFPLKDKVDYRNIKTQGIITAESSFIKLHGGILTLIKNWKIETQMTSD